MYLRPNFIFVVVLYEQDTAYRTCTVYSLNIHRISVKNYCPRVTKKLYTKPINQNPSYFAKDSKIKTRWYKIVHSFTISCARILLLSLYGVQCLAVLWINKYQKQHQTRGYNCNSRKLYLIVKGCAYTEYVRLRCLNHSSLTKLWETNISFRCRLWIEE